VEMVDYIKILNLCNKSTIPSFVVQPPPIIIISITKFKSNNQSSSIIEYKYYYTLLWFVMVDFLNIKSELKLTRKIEGNNRKVVPLNSTINNRETIFR
jgi:hypothetical protein